jgi:uncharacterized phage protein (TIGR02218 family)
MKPVSTEYLTMIRQQQRSIIADLYTVTLATGPSDYFTDFDIDVIVNGQSYKSQTLRFEGMKLKIAVGLEVDEQDVKISALPSDTLHGANFLQAMVDGLLDGAWLTRDRAVWRVISGNVFNDVDGADPIQVTRLFYGRISDITKIGRTFVELKVKSPLVLLNIDMPRNVYANGCNWTLFDQGCTMIKESWGTHGSVGTASSTFIQWAGGVPNVTGGDGRPFYEQGRMRFTSGVLAGEQIYIVGNDSNGLGVLGLESLPQTGDNFIAYAGCGKTMNACQHKFNNLQHFRGFPFVPPVVFGI